MNKDLMPVFVKQNRFSDLGFKQYSGLTADALTIAPSNDPYARYIVINATKKGQKSKRLFLR